jgi:hypothetical protein
MNSSPRRNQPRLLAFNLLHHPAQIGSVDANDPIDPAAAFEYDLRFATMPEYMDMGRSVIVGENHKSKPWAR